jgi:hypothetical protein
LLRRLLPLRQALQAAPTCRAQRSVTAAMTQPPSSPPSRSTCNETARSVHTLQGYHAAKPLTCHLAHILKLLMHFSLVRALYNI